MISEAVINNDVLIALYCALLIIVFFGFIYHLQRERNRYRMQFDWPGQPPAKSEEASEVDRSTQSTQAGLTARIDELRGLAEKVTAFEASGCEVTDPHDTYPPELWSAATRHTSLMPLIEALAQRPTTHPTPLDAVLFCPECGLQHIDEPYGEWTNPPHRKHLCRPEHGGCNHIWQPLEVTTNGVRSLKAHGSVDGERLGRAAPAMQLPS